MSLQVENITISFAPTNPADISDQKGELNFNATVQTESSTGKSKLTVIFSGEEVELYSLNGYSKQTEKFDKKVRPVNSPENTIFAILKANGKLKSRNYKSDNEAKNFIATGMYIPNSRSGTQQFQDAAQQLFQASATPAERSQVANASSEASNFTGTQSSDSPDTTTSGATGEPGAEIPEGSSTPDASSPPVTASDVEGGGGEGSNSGGDGSDSQSLTGDINSQFSDDSSASLPGPAGGGANGGGLFYPQKLLNLDQDYMKFITFRYKPEELKIAQSGLLTLERNFDNLGSGDGPPIYLPIQGIVDRNTVGWGPNSLNPVQAAFFGLAQGLIGGDGDNVNRSLEGAQKLLENHSGVIGQGVKIYMGQQAVGASGLLSRAGGAIVNPNLTLLFNNPELRKFSFTFRLSPRNDTEATMVRQIIRTFKQAMAVRKEKTHFFLLAPNLFKITYHTGSSSEHKSIGKAKVCALVACGVNYVPDGSYMTFDDSARTMTSYELSLSFNEVEPVYYDDYKDLGPDEIGF